MMSPPKISDSIGFQIKGLRFIRRNVMRMVPTLKYIEAQSEFCFAKPQCCKTKSNDAKMTPERHVCRLKKVGRKLTCTQSTGTQCFRENEGYYCWQFELPWSSCRHMLPYSCHSLRRKNLQPCNMHQELTPRAMLLQSR